MGLERALHLVAAELLTVSGVLRQAAKEDCGRALTEANADLAGTGRAFIRAIEHPDALSRPIDQVLLEAVTGYLVEHVWAPGMAAARAPEISFAS